MPHGVHRYLHVDPTHYWTSFPAPSAPKEPRRSDCTLSNTPKPIGAPMYTVAQDSSQPTGRAAAIVKRLQG
eukprot:6507326-Prymnesium_polylepis.1